MTDNSDILQTRASKLATSSDAGEKAEEQICLLEFRVNEETYGIEIRYTKEVAPFTEYTSLPDTPEFILGIMNIRQRVTSIMDLKKVLNIPNKEEEKKRQVVVIEENGLEFALLVDEIIGMKVISKSSVQPPPSTFSGLQKDLLLGVTQEKLILLNGKTFFQKKSLLSIRK